MSAKPTPETDARVAKMTGELKADEFIPADFARDLERRLTAALSENEKLTRQLKKALKDLDELESAVIDPEEDEE